jgi:hypothetical protein
MAAVTDRWYMSSILGDLKTAMDGAATTIDDLRVRLVHNPGNEAIVEDVATDLAAVRDGLNVASGMVGNAGERLEPVMAAVRHVHAEQDANSQEERSEPDAPKATKRDRKRGG